MNYREIPMTPEIAGNLKEGDKIKTKYWDKVLLFDLKLSLLVGNRLYFIALDGDESMVSRAMYIEDLVLLVPVEYEWMYIYKRVEIKAIYDTQYEDKSYFKNNKHFLEYKQYRLEHYEKIEFTKREVTE